MDPFYLSLICLVLAVGLAAVDLLVPSGGLLLILACASALGAILFGFRAGTTQGMIMLTLIVAAIPILLAIAIRIWPHTPLGRRIILRPPKKSKEKEEAKSSAKSERKKGSAGPILEQLVGTVHELSAALLPSGQIKVGHRFLNATAESGFIDEGSRVEVIAVRERNLIVRPTEKPVSPVASQAKQGEDASSEETNDANLLEMSAEELGLDSIDLDQE